MNTLQGLDAHDDMSIEEICNYSDAYLEKFCRQAAVLEDALKNYGTVLFDKYEQKAGELSMVREYYAVHDVMKKVLEDLQTYIKRSLETQNSRQHLAGYLAQLTVWDITMGTYMEFIIEQVLGKQEAQEVFAILNVFIRVPKNRPLGDLHIPYQGRW